MRKTMILLAATMLASFLGSRPEVAPTPDPETHEMTAADALELGNFSVSLTVKDIKASKAFYEKLGFREVGGKMSQRWLILQNGTTTIGLFQGMFPRNTLTFNPGWDHERKTPADFTDVREIQALLEKRGLELQAKADPESTGVAHISLVDPDGNPILIDQHVPRPKKK